MAVSTRVPKLTTVAGKVPVRVDLSQYDLVHICHNDIFLSIFIIRLWAVAGKVEPSQQQPSWQTEQSTKNIYDFEMC